MRIPASDGFKLLDDLLSFVLASCRDVNSCIMLQKGLQIVWHEYSRPRWASITRDAPWRSPCRRRCCLLWQYRLYQIGLECRPRYRWAWVERIPDTRIEKYPWQRVYSDRFQRVDVKVVAVNNQRTGSQVGVWKLSPFCMGLGPLLDVYI